jgi:hypothetical protein
MRRLAGVLDLNVLAPPFEIRIIQNNLFSEMFVFCYPQVILLDFVARDCPSFDIGLEGRRYEVLVLVTVKIVFQLSAGLELDRHYMRKCLVALTDVYADAKALHRRKQPWKVG